MTEKGGGESYLKNARLEVDSIKKRRMEMKSRSFLGGEKIVHSLIMTVCISLFLFVFVLSAGSVGAAAKTYEEYVSSLPDECEAVPRECFNQAMQEGQLNIYDWAAWWPEELFTGFQKEFGIKIVRDNFSNYDAALTKFKLYPKAPYDWWYGTPKQLTQVVPKGLLHEFNHSWIPNYPYTRILCNQH